MTLLRWLSLSGTFLAVLAQYAMDPPSSYLDLLHSERGIMEFLGSKTPFDGHADTFSLSDVPEQCRLVHMNHVIRHGSRHSTSSDSFHRLKATLVAAEDLVTEAGRKTHTAVESMRQDQQLNSGSLASHAKPEALQTIAPLWNAYMSDISDLLAANRKIVVESTPSERCSEYAGHLVDAIKFVAPVENDTFPIVPVANQGLLMQIHPDQGENRNGTWSRSALLRPYKHCAKALAAREKAKEAVAASSQDDDSQLESSEWFVQEVQPYERLTPLTPLELRKLERRWANAGSLSQGSVAVSPSGDGAEDDSRAAAHPLPDTREEALLRDVFAGGFIANLPNVIPQDQCAKFRWGSPRDCAIATVAWDLFEVCRMDAGAFSLSKGLCNIWKLHIPLMEKFDYMQDMINLHTKGYYSPEATGATCPLLEDVFSSADAAMHTIKRQSTHQPSWRGVHDNYWLAGSGAAPPSIRLADAVDETVKPWGSKNGRGPAWNMHVTHAGTLVPLFALLGLQEHPFLPTLRERFHVYSREPVPPGASPVNFTRTMQMHRYNRLVALAYGFEDPPESISSTALVPKLEEGQIPPPPPPMPQAPNDQHMSQGGGNDAFDPSTFAPGFTRGDDARATPQELQDLNLQNTRLGLVPETQMPPPVGSQPHKGPGSSGSGVDPADLQQEVLLEAAAKRGIRQKLRAAEDPVWGITQLGELHGMEYMEHLPKDYVKIMSMYMKGVEGVGVAAFKHPLTAARLVPMGGHFGLSLFQCGGNPDSRHRRVREQPVTYKASAMVHGRQVPFPACPTTLYCDWERVKAYYREHVYSSLPVGECSPTDVAEMCGEAQ